MKLRFQFGLIIWLLLYIPFAQIAFGQSVLCLGIDGHVALENTGSDGTCHDDVHQAQVLDSGCLSLGHCGPCLDLLPDLDHLNPSRQDLSILAMTSVVSVVHVSPVSSSSWQPSPDFFPQTLHVSVPTTVLQI